jgi:hypothetical protein
MQVSFLEASLAPRVIAAPACGYEIASAGSSAEQYPAHRESFERGRGGMGWVPHFLMFIDSGRLPEQRDGGNKGV